MFRQLKIFLFNRRTWVYNLQYIFLSLVILVAVTYMDQHQSLFSQVVPGFFYTRLELAKTVLSSLSSGLLAITIFAFSSILSMLTFYSGNFSPRVVENFVGKKITMKVLGIFIGGFTYCITSLNFMRGEDGDRLVLAGTVGMIYVIFCIIYLIIFIQKTVRDVQVVHLISDIYQESLPVIDKEVKGRDVDDIKDKGAFDHYTPIYSAVTGYFELFNTEKAAETLKAFQGILHIPVKAGDFIVEGQEIGRLIDAGQKDATDLCEKLLSSYEVHENKISITDYVFGLEKIKEIAVMALSPGVNDPATAIHCIRKMSTLLSALATTDAHHHIKPLQNGGHIYYTSNEFSQDLYVMLAPIANYGKNDPQVIAALFEGLMIMAAVATAANQKAIAAFAAEIYEAGQKSAHLKMDEQYMTRHYQRLLAKIEGNR